jgi:hypothetical protein
MRIGGQGISVSRDLQRREPERTAGTSLVALDAAAPQAGNRYRQTRTLAAFVTQLIAKSQDTPHLRDRRRADPSVAANAYGKMLNLGGVPKRHKARPF